MFKTETLKWSCYCVPKTEEEFIKLGLKYYIQIWNPEIPMAVYRAGYSSGEDNVLVDKEGLNRISVRTEVTVDQYLDLIEGNLYVPWRLEMDGFVAVNSEAKYPVYKKVVEGGTESFNDIFTPPHIRVYPANPMEQKGAVQLFDSSFKSRNLTDDHEKLVPLFMKIDSYSKMIFLVNLW